MTSRWPYWCPKTMKQRPCWCPKPILWELNSFLMQTLSFVPINLHRCWPREWKHSIGWFSNRTGTSVDDGARKSNNWLDQCMTERQIGHRKSCLVLSAHFPVVKWRSRSVAKSSYCQRGNRAKKQNYNTAQCRQKLSNFRNPLKFAFLTIFGCK